jgi:hypothetical protein
MSSGRPWIASGSAGPGRAEREALTSEHDVGASRLVEADDPKSAREALVLGNVRIQPVVDGEIRERRSEPLRDARELDDMGAGDEAGPRRSAVARRRRRG